MHINNSYLQPIIISSIQRVLIISSCRHSGNQGTTGRPARAHYIVGGISLRTRRSKPGEALVLVETSTRNLSRGIHSKGLGEAFGFAKSFSLQAGSISAIERTWFLLSPQSRRYAKAW